VGSGGSQDAAYTLKADVPAGTYHVVCDAIILGSVDVTFDLIWRRGSTDMTIATWSKHFDQIPNNFDAQAYEVDETGPAIDWKDGDQLVFRYAGASATSAQAFIPNGDGENANGRLPNITLPP
jgi:hypothetical protein